MTVIKAITYAESREAFFEKQLRRARRGLDNVVKYGADPDACAERGEMVAFYQDALSALREQAERDKGCEYCLQESVMAYGMDKLEREAYIYLDGNLLTADLYSDSMAVAICFCPMCGRRLGGDT